ncbi:LPO_1073/Vpar_1526 family protein [Phyllobacterium sp. CCNWLW109]|uniref:LPO_1073/Vpar_1526 family protein n=1 Tax=Phyllobacterium sp. CCNWLW109 TaxID=3127479 RepID=UPI0030788822
MTDSQKGTAHGSATVIQSARDTIVGNSAEDMKLIIEALGDQMLKFASVAKETAQARLDKFEEMVLNRFAKMEDKYSSAFQDPDFQYLIGQSQRAYARSGEDYTAEILVDLIEQRALEPARNRLSLTLNDAVEKTAVLTASELAELSLIFALRYTLQPQIQTIADLGAYLSEVSKAFLSDVEEDSSSYTYLASHSCVSIEITALSLYEIINETYARICSNGADKSEYTPALNGMVEVLDTALLVPSQYDQGRFVLATNSMTHLRSILNPVGLGHLVEPLWNLQKNFRMPQEELIIKLEKFFPEIRNLVAIWDHSPLKSCILTSTGIAIGYANYKRKCGFEPDLSVWIK